MQTIPLIDVASLRQAAPSADVARALCDALHNTGFCTISGHGVNKVLQEKLMELARLFFAQSSEGKAEISMSHGGRAWRGYFPVGGELTSGKPDQKEGIYFGWEHGDDHPGVVAGLALHGKNQWPRGEEFQDLPALLAEYLTAMRTLGQDLLSGVALGLGLAPSYFSKRFTSDPTVLFRIFNYPRHLWADGEDQWGVREHTDMGFLTLLLQDDQGGLEVKGEGGNWIPVPPIPNTFVVNIGDMLEVWTHGIFRATPHRVKNQGSRDRLSLPFFFDPAWSAPLEPIDLGQLAPRVQQQVRPLGSLRWDGRDLSQLASRLTYGEYVWDKVKDVFPSLA